MNIWFTLEKEKPTVLKHTKRYHSPGNSPAVQWLQLGKLGPWVRFLVRELRFTRSMACAKKKKKKKKF